ncbi:MAG: hypothetical protein UEY44_06890 [Coprococcus sp.]|nr:hypothetical protein [Coprococcus sp.]
MKFLRLLRRDINLGTVRRLFMYIIPVVIAYMQVSECNKLYVSFLNDGTLTAPATVIDYLMYCTQGMFIFHFDPSQHFVIPIYWFLFFISISYIIAYYAHDDYEGNGRNIYLAVGNRRSWWNAKCVWCILSVVVYYIAYLAGIALLTLIKGGKLSLTCNRKFVDIVLSNNASALSIKEIMIIMVLLPLLIVSGICLVQMFMGFIVTPIASFAIISGVYVVSAYYTVWWLPGNYTMWLRSSLINEEGVRPVSGIVYGFIMMFMAWYGGRSYFENADVM